MPLNYGQLPCPFTFNLRNIIGQEGEKWWDYGGYGDDELISRIAECLGADNARPQNDWAYPGELAGDLPNEVLMSPSYHKTRSLKSTSSELQSNTNLIISVNSIKANAYRNPENCITGVVYTIGVSIQGDECVWFRGSLFDFHSNTVATASAVARAELDSVEMFFDARDIFENSSGGPYTLGKVELTVDDNYSTNNVLGVLYDFAVEPIDVAKDELLCNKGYILDTVINEQSETGVVATVSTKINIADGYLVSAELVSTNDELVALTSVSNLCVVGTNIFRLAFSSDAIYQNGVSGICAVKNVKLWQNDELIDADATGAELSSIYDCSDFVPSNACVAVNQNSGRFIDPSMTTDGKLSSLRFVFDVTNGTDATIGYDVAAVLMGTNSALVASINTPVYVTNGVNQIELSIPASDIAASGEDGPYRFESIELLPQGESSCGTTYRPSVLSTAYTASDFGASAIEACGTPRLVDTPDSDRLMVEYSYEALRTGRVIEEVVLADRNGDFAARVAITNDVAEIGVMTNRISIASGDVVGGVTNSPYAVACLSLTPDIIGESPVYMDTGSLTNIFWQVASPVFAPATKTVFFRNGQPIAISCATTAAEIRYTLDGSEPTETSALYDGSLAISSNTTVKAKAFAEGMRPSETVQAEYIRAAVVGENLVQTPAPVTGVPQILKVPLPGTYEVSFDYQQGGNIELRLSRGGDVHTIAAVPAGAAGSTNLVVDIASAGDYELTVWRASPEAAVSNLNIAIPGTEENRSRFWIYETEATYQYTGEWSCFMDGAWTAGTGFLDGRIPVNKNVFFMPYNKPSGGSRVSITTTVSFHKSMERHRPLLETDTKAAVIIGENESGENMFMVLTDGAEEGIWKEVHADGIGAPALGSTYTFRLVIDKESWTYSVALVDDGREIPLADGYSGAFPIPKAARDSSVEVVAFSGEGDVFSLLGDYGVVAPLFAEGETLHLGGTEEMVLTDGQARWLNSIGRYENVKAKAGEMDMDGMSAAYLLNLDLTKDGFGLVSFKVSGIEVAESEVRIKVSLVRSGAMKVGGSGENRNAPINGLLKLYGGDTPHAKTILNATKVTGADFGDGDTAIFTYPRGGGARFFRPAIEAYKK